MMTQGIKVKDHYGTWYVIDQNEYKGKTVYLLESEIYGDGAGHIIIDDDYNVLQDEVYNGFDDLDDDDDYLPFC